MPSILPPLFLTRVRGDRHRVVAGFSSQVRKFRLPLVLAQGSPVFLSSCQGERGIALESWQGNRTSRRVEEGLSRSFTGWGRKPLVPSTCACVNMCMYGGGDETWPSPRSSWNPPSRHYLPLPSFRYSELLLPAHVQFMLGFVTKNPKNVGPKLLFQSCPQPLSLLSSLRQAYSSSSHEKAFCCQLCAHL